MRRHILIIVLTLALSLVLFGCKTGEMPEEVVAPEPTENPVPEQIVDDAPTPVPTASAQEPAATQTPVPQLVFDTAALAGMEHAAEYSTLHEQNSDVRGWITVPNTKIDYAAALGEDNEHYLHTTLEGEESKSGSIFFDYRTDDALLGKHLILYGHNMRAGTMFHDLGSYKLRDFFENNRIITLYAGSEKREYEVFAAYIAEPGTYFIRMFFRDDAHFLEYFQNLQTLSKFSTDVVLEADDQILTLCTCTYEVDDARFVVQARLVK